MAGNVWVSPDSIKPDATTTCNGITVNKYLLKSHNVNGIDLPSKRTQAFKGVVIHNTNRAKSADDGRQYTAATLNNNVATRTHFYVTELGAWQNLELGDMNWSCGDGAKGTGNNGCISLEIIMDTKNSANDLKSRDNGAKLAAWILYKKGMTVNDMYTHNYFLNIRDGLGTSDYMTLCTTPTKTRNCPYYIVWDWEGFRKQVDMYVKALGGKSVYDAEPIAPESKSSSEVNYIYQAVSTAAIRADTSKTAKMYGRVVYADYYPVDRLYTVGTDVWLRHAHTNTYSMLDDGGALFRRYGEYEEMRTTVFLNARSKPTTKSDIITTLPEKTVVYVVKGIESVKADNYTWVKIIFEGKACYVAREFLKP